MATELGFVEFIVDQIADDCGITYKKMFGDYGLWSHGKIVALICDGQLFVKQTEGGRAFVGEIVEAPPYPGAKPSLLITDRIEDSEFLSELIRITYRELPAPKPQPKPKKKPKNGK